MAWQIVRSFDVKDFIQPVFVLRTYCTFFLYLQALDLIDMRLVALKMISVFEQ